MPARLRRHVAAIYAFARTADDFADEPGRAPDERLRLLDEWQGKLHQAPVDATFLALHDTMEQFQLPVGLFEDLLSAFKQDVVKTRYASWEAVLDYCRRSANPVGRLVLRLSGYRDAELDRASDAVCTALQLTNFWQDLAIDWPRGRLYVPEEVWRTAGADPATLDRGRMTPEWTVAMRACGQRTRRLFDDGRSVCDGVSGRLRYELRATWLGGSRILDRLEQVDYDVFTSRPALGTSDAIVIVSKTLLWPATPRSPIRS
ncbi:MAG: squalene synthase HpnC [Acidobacterium sp.]|nr:squalene synthase HpnC [Acidobacteriota bacterium]PHY11550.1 MAG: squalene synthase HpnC [Acidobacterium sp.]